MRTIRNRFLRSVAAAAVGGVCFQIGGCLQLSGIVNYLSNFNPCGTILACDPVQYRFMTSGYEGPGINVAVDPMCTYPPFCAGDPFIGGGGQPP